MSHDSGSYTRHAHWSEVIFHAEVQNLFNNLCRILICWVLRSAGLVLEPRFTKSVESSFPAIEAFPADTEIAAGLRDAVELRGIPKTRSLWEASRLNVINFDRPCCKNRKTTMSRRTSHSYKPRKGQESRNQQSKHHRKRDAGSQAVTANARNGAIRRVQISAPTFHGYP